jgi:hypothetical protein
MPVVTTPEEIDINTAEKLGAVLHEAARGGRLAARLAARTEHPSPPEGRLQMAT